MDRGRRAEPYSSATVWTREVAKNLAGHLDRLSKAHSCVDTASPKSTQLPRFQHPTPPHRRPSETSKATPPPRTTEPYDHLDALNPCSLRSKPSPRALDHLVSPKTAGKLSSGKLPSCGTSPRLILPVNDRTQGDSASVYDSPSKVKVKRKTKVTYAAKQQQMKILHENQLLAKRIRNTKGTYQAKDWAKDEERNKKIWKAREKHRQMLQNEMKRAQSVARSARHVPTSMDIPRSGLVRPDVDVVVSTSGSGQVTVDKGSKRDQKSGWRGKKLDSLSSDELLEHTSQMVRELATQQSVASLSARSAQTESGTARQKVSQGTNETEKTELVDIRFIGSRQGNRLASDASVNPLAPQSVDMHAMTDPTDETVPSPIGNKGHETEEVRRQDTGNETSSASEMGEKLVVEAREKYKDTAEHVKDVHEGGLDPLDEGKNEVDNNSSDQAEEKYEDDIEFADAEEDDKIEAKEAMEEGGNSVGADKGEVKDEERKEEEEKYVDTEESGNVERKEDKCAQNNFADMAEGDNGEAEEYKEVSETLADEVATFVAKGDEAKETLEYTEETDVSEEKKEKGETAKILNQASYSALDPSDINDTDMVATSPLKKDVEKAFQSQDKKLYLDIEDSAVYEEEDFENEEGPTEPKEDAILSAVQNDEPLPATDILENKDIMKTNAPESEAKVDVLNGIETTQAEDDYADDDFDASDTEQ